MLSSCATIFHDSSHDVVFSSDAPGAKVQVNDSIYQLPATISLKRSRDDLSVKLISDSLTRDFIVYSSLNNTFA